MRTLAIIFGPMCYVGRIYRRCFAVSLPRWPFFSFSVLWPNRPKASCVIWLHYCCRYWHWCLDLSVHSTLGHMIDVALYLCKGTECCDASCVNMKDVWPSLGRGMAVIVDPGSSSSSGAVIRKQLVVDCTLRY